MAWNRSGGWANLPPAQVDIARIIDVTDTEAFLVRKDGDGGDIFVVDTTNGTVSFGGVTPVTGTRILVPVENDAATPTIAFGDGDTGIHELNDDTLRVAIAGNDRWEFTVNHITGAATGYSALRYVNSSATTPGLVPGNDDLDTGMGTAAADQISFIAGGVEGARITEAQRTIETNATVAETDGGDLRIVTVAAHALSIDDVVQFADGTGTISTDLTAATNYYVTQVDDANKFNISTSRGGSNVAFNDAGTAFDSFEQEITINGYGPIVAPIGTAAQPSLVVSDKDGSTDNGFYAHATTADRIDVSLGGTSRFYLTSEGVLGTIAGSGKLVCDRAASATVPTLVPDRSDANTGIGQAAADQLSLVAGAVEGIRITTSASVAYPTFGGNVNAQALEIRVSTTEETGMTGATVTATNLIPAASLVLGVTVYVTTTIEGGSDFDIGDGTDPDAWGNGIAYASGTTSTIADFTVTTPAFYASATSVVLTQQGAGNFTAGACRITVHYINLTAATS